MCPSRLEHHGKLKEEGVGSEGDAGDTETGEDTGTSNLAVAVIAKTTRLPLT